jgi:hypothetical protein
MPSQSLQQWSTQRAAAMNELEIAHQSVGGLGPGRRYATQQINHAYAVLVSSQFQGYCRDIHSESADYIVQGILPNSLRNVCRNALIEARKLDRGNPNPGNLGSDFKRFGVMIWPLSVQLDARIETCHDQLKALNECRNAIAHQDFSGSAGIYARLRIEQVRRWRTACQRIAVAFDKVMHRELTSMTGTSPW